MRSIARLFGKSPFSPLQTHMKKVTFCVEKLSSVFGILAQADMSKIEKYVAELSHLEHEADITKNDIRNHLPKSIFLPIDRSQFLEILALQDSIADKAEDIGLLLTLRPLDSMDNFLPEVLQLFKKNETVFRSAVKIMEEIDELLESSFGGIEAEKVKAMVEATAAMEHEADRMQRTLLKKIYTHGDHLTPPAFSMWRTLVDEIGALANLSEKLANRIRMILELR